MFWMGGLMALATALSQSGFIKWAAAFIANGIAGAHMGWISSFLIISLIYIYSHYCFASVTARISAMYAAFVAVAAACGAPALMVAVAFGIFANLPISLTHYGNGAVPVKARAVQAALGGVVTDKTKLLDDAAVYATGLPGTSVHSHHQAAPGLRVQYMYNEIGGYGNYTVPVVGPVIIQAVMLMAITMALGGWLVAARREPFVEAALDRPLHRGAAVWLAFTLITFLWFVYMQGFDFWWHEYGSMRSVAATLGTGLLFSASVASFGMAVTILLGSNRWSSQAVVMISAPAVFISGGIWPMTNVLSEPVFALSLFIPTSPAVPALLAASQDGALTESILPYWGILGIQTLFYLSTALHLVHRRDWREDAVQAYSRGALRREPFVKTDRPSDWDY